MKIFFSIEEQAETQSHAEFEVNLFKAYLVLNSRFTQMQNTAISSTEHLEDEEFRIPMMMFCTDYPISDKIHYNIDRIWVVQIIKAIYLFQFLESNEQTRPLLNEYIKYFEKNSWQDYLKALISLTISVIKKDEETYTDIVVSEENFEKECAFIEKFIVLPDEELDEYDFLSLRSKPFYKVENGKYRVIFDLFVAEKIFKGVYFILREINKKLDKENQISEIKSFFGKEFSEKVLAYKVIEKIYKGKCVKYSGQEMDDLDISGAPDYYIRIGTNILVFESKDFLIGKDKKNSFNFDVYLEEFERVLYFEKTKKKEKHKAVKQLISNVERLIKLEFLDKGYKYKDVNIYPILLTHDHQYDTFGFNRLIDDWFQFELGGLQEKGLFIHKVKPLTVVNVDTLIFHEMGLSNEMSLHKLIDEYCKQTNINRRPQRKITDRNQAQEFCMSKHISFATFADNFFDKRKFTKIPSVLEAVKDALFDKEEEFLIKQ